MPPGFSWVDKPHLAALAMPESADDLTWLRKNGVEVLISLTEDPPQRRWINEAGLLSVHVPIQDMTAPSTRQFDLCVETMNRAKKTGPCIAPNGLIPGFRFGAARRRRPLDLADSDVRAP